MVELLAINPKRADDKFYRYKMPRLQVKVEGKGNGIKTVIVNLSTVAQSLARPGGHVIKWFGLDLGAQTNMDPPDDRWIVNGAHDGETLQKSLFVFIEKYVLCDDCGNPETDLSIKDEIVRKDCKACGARSKPLVHSNLINFILKTQSKKGKKSKTTKAERQAARRAKQLADDDEFIKAAAQVNHAPKEVKDDDWSVDMSEQAVKARQNALPDEFRDRLVLEGADDDDDESSGPTVYDELGNWILEQAKANGVDNVDDIEIYKKAKELGIETKHKTVLILAQTLFDQNIVAQIPKRAGILKQNPGKISDRHEKAFLGGIECLLAKEGKENPKLLSSDVVSNKILYQLYDKELISEEFIRKWGSKASKKYCDLKTSRAIRKASEPFIMWLDEADEESSDDE
ncbi:domain found in IF2B/IF5-domain-containing protein [Truncatella angustata]|uniref:Domain found in IF2B/IF5-domain-containing protein n=1 Tax=Truncatella angustata TaxID=152316 RepID=A0A9P8ULN4_9PEZI|nr:domain found in IF2B/IF5-domain-containing protein [Truncatella angustata]KAH6654384.1 domain found in IF2B/IF5-domain-containing protein [Truncatella angustata]